MSSWIVLLEAAASAVGGSIDVEQLQTLSELLDADAALHSPERYALQLRRSGTRPIDALDRGLTQWEDAVAALGLARWELVRAEVFTLEELERELGDEDVEGMLTGVAVADESDSRGAAEAVADELLQGIFRDPLTGLPNEEALRARIDQVLARARHTGRGPAVIFVDLDGFDAVNRRLGHGAGDHVLVEVAQRLTAATRPSDGLARVGADSFGLVLEDASTDAAASVSARIVAALRAPLEVSGHQLDPVASVGVARAEPGQSPEVVLQAAAAGVAAARAAGGNGWEIFTGKTEGAGGQVLDRPAGSHDRLSYLLLMQRAAVAANEATTVHEAAQVVLRQVCAHTGWPVGHLLVVSPERPDELVSTGVWHLPANDRYRSFQQSTEAISFSAGVGLPGRVLACAEPLWSSNLSADPEPQRAAAAAQDGLRVGFAFPVLVAREVVAVLEFFSSEESEPNGSLLDVLAAVGTQLGRVVERSRAHDALRDSQALLREAQRLGRLGSWHTDLRTGRTTWSDELYVILGADPAFTAPGLESFLAVVHPQDRELVEADTRRKALVGDTGSPLEFRVVQPDGEIRWVVRRCSFLCDAAGDTVAFHATVQDISDHKRTAECSLSCELRWQLMLQGSQETLTILNEDGTIRFCLAPVGTDPLGSSNGQPTMLVDAVHPDDAGIVMQALAELRADPDSSVAFQVRVRGDAGEWRWFESLASNLLEEPLIGAIVLNSLDVTEWRRLQEELAQTALQR